MERAYRSRGTTVHFLIENVVVNESSQYSGVLLRWVQNGAIMDSSISGGLDGVNLYSSSSVLIAMETEPQPSISTTTKAQTISGLATHLI